MEQAKQFEDLFNKTSEYLETRASLVKLKTIQKTSDVVSIVASKIIGWLLACTVLLMLSIALAFFLGDLLGATYVGFLIVAGIYALLGLLYYFLKDSWIKAPVTDAIIKKMTSK